MAQNIQEATVKDKIKTPKGFIDVIYDYLNNGTLYFGLRGVSKIKPSEWNIPPETKQATDEILFRDCIAFAALDLYMKYKGFDIDIQAPPDKSENAWNDLKIYLVWGIDIDKKVSQKHKTEKKLSKPKNDNKDDIKEKICIRLEDFSNTTSRQLLEDLLNDKARKGVTLDATKYGNGQPKTLRKILRLPNHGLGQVADSIKLKKNTVKLDIPPSKITIN